MRQPLIALGALTVFALIPWFGHFFNGMSYVTTRWCFAYAFAFCSVTSLVVPRLHDFTKRDWRFAAVGMVILLLFLALGAWRGSNPLGCGLTGVYLVCAALVLWAVIKKNVTLRTWSVCMVLVALVGVGYSTNMFLALGSSPYVKELLSFGKAYERLTTAEANYFIVGLQDSDDAPYRYDEPTDAAEIVDHNANSFTGQLGINFFCSIYDQDVDNFRTQLALPCMNGVQAHMYHGSGSRAALEAVSGVKYFMNRVDGGTPVPYGFDEVVQEDTVERATYSLATKGKGLSLGLIKRLLTGNALVERRTSSIVETYISERALPIAFTYPSTVSPWEYEELTPIQKQQALLQGCVTDLDFGSVVHPQDKAEMLSFSLEDSSDALLRVNGNESVEPGQLIAQGGSGAIECEKKKQKLTFGFEGRPNSETYLYLSNFHFTPPAGTALRGSLNVKLTCEDDVSTTIVCTTKASNFFAGKETWLINLGYHEDAVTKASITLPQKGTYSFSDLQILSLPMDDFDEQVERLQAVPVEDLRLEINGIGGTVANEEPCALYVSTPHSVGWTATVDGQEAELHVANTAFMALELQPGRHDIEFHYESPGLRLGIALMLVGVAATVAIGLASRKRQLRCAASRM